MRKYFIWYRAFVKRLFHKISFIVLLCLIPVMLPLGNAAMSDDSGVLTIALSSENADETSQSIIENLTNRSSMIRFKEYKKNAVEAVESGEADAAWIFKENTGERIDKYAAKKSLKPIVEVYEREDSVPLKISREVLYESLYEKLAFSVYKNYVREALAADITDEELSVAYQKERLGDIIEIKRFNSDTLVKKTNYLTLPFRGFLSIIIFLCAMAGAMFFLEDDKQGKYAWLSSKKR